MDSSTEKRDARKEQTNNKRKKSNKKSKTNKTDKKIYKPKTRMNFNGPN